MNGTLLNGKFQSFFVERETTDDARKTTPNASFYTCNTEWSHAAAAVAVATRVAAAAPALASGQSATAGLAAMTGVAALC